MLYHLINNNLRW